ncbi:hypothetical protein [Pseudomonas sp. GR 6-02]|uniref:hypothetical protein n=1 Tax=Pseudomonas sp. GR 6-02 TaxID=1659194 RepID=UPI0007E3B190|nr:hypothetical protein [Pseudomonas sp. GR 6-02]
MKCKKFDYDAHFNDAGIGYEIREELQGKLERQLNLIEFMVDRFNDSLKGESRVELIFSRGLDVSPMSSSTFAHTVRFPVQLVIEYYEFLSTYFGAPSFDLTGQRCRRTSIALMYAISHELSHNLKGHNKVSSCEGLTTDETSLAAETDADFSAGMMCFLFYFNSQEGGEIDRLLSLTKNAGPLFPFCKDSGYSAVMLAFFLHCKTKGGASNYHSANIRYKLLAAGVLFAILKVAPKMQGLLFSGVDEAIEALRVLDFSLHKEHVESFLADDYAEFLIATTTTSGNVDKLRAKWESSSDLIAIAKKYMAGGI